MEVRFETEKHQEEGSVFLEDGRKLTFKIEEAPIKVGDQVEGHTMSTPHTVLYIHALDTDLRRQWAITAFKGDIPVVKLLTDLVPYKDVY